MAKRISNIDVTSSAPFQHDALDVEQKVRAFTSFVQSIEPPFSISLEGEWGSGKTTFVKMSAALLASDNWPTLYVNAWETDFAQDPLIAVTGDLDELVASASQNSQLKRNWKKAKKAANSIVRRSVPAAIKVATIGIVDLKEIEEDAVSDLVRDALTPTVESYGALKSSIRDFRKHFEGSIAELLQQSGKPFAVVFIDELDRCRPDYALSFLERTKHVLSVTNVVFVFSIDRNQLSHGLRGLFGEEFLGHRYLDKFFDVGLPVSNASKDEFVRRAFDKTHVSKVLEPRSKHQEFADDLPLASQVFQNLALNLGTSPRDIERWALGFELALGQVKANEYMWPDITAFLVATRYSFQTSYRDFVESEMHPNEWFGELANRNKGFLGFRKSEEGMRVEAALVVARAGRGELDLRPYLSPVQDNARQLRYEKEFERLGEYIQHFTRYHRRLLLSHIVTRIELTSRK